MSNALDASPLAGLRVGDLLPRHLVAFGRARRIDAVALIAPGGGDLSACARELEAHADDFAAWDGRIAWLEADGDPKHRVVIVDRYGQVYDVTTASDAIDDPLPRDWTP